MFIKDERKRGRTEDKPLLEEEWVIKLKRRKRKERRKRRTKRRKRRGRRRRRNRRKKEEEKEEKGVCWSPAGQQLLTSCDMTMKTTHCI